MPTARSSILAMLTMTVLSDQEIEQRLAGSEWLRERGLLGEGDVIARELKFEDFSAAIAFVETVAATAEAANHHPDILVHGWNKVRLELCTHSEDGLTAADFELAARIDQLA
jgi:4a-hydroxytetrahydrobiopterin dehydratase